MAGRDLTAPMHGQMPSSSRKKEMGLCRFLTYIQQSYHLQIGRVTSIIVPLFTSLSIQILP